MHLRYFPNEKQEDGFRELTAHQTVHLNNCFNRSKGFTCVDMCVFVCEVMQCEAFGWTGES